MSSPLNAVGQNGKLRPTFSPPPSSFEGMNGRIVCQAIITVLNLLFQRGKSVASLSQCRSIVSQPPLSRPTTCYHLWQWPSLPPFLRPSSVPSFGAIAERAPVLGRHFFCAIFRSRHCRHFLLDGRGRTNCTRPRLWRLCFRKLPLSLKAFARI